jgi:hypothetical protein
MGKVKSRSGSQRRRTTKRINVNCTPERYDAISKLTEAYGQSPSALALHTLLGIPLPRSRRPRADDELMRQFFTEIARARDALKPVEAELGKSGSNVNQIAAVLNADRPPETVMNILKETLLAHQQAVEAVEEFIRDLRELRTAGMNAMGLELGHGGTDDGEERRRKAPGAAARKPVAKAG